MKKMHSLLAFSFFISAASYAQIAKPEIRGNKQMVTVNRPVASFSHIRVIGLDAIIEKAVSKDLQITAESNITEFVKSDMSGDTLVLSLDTRMQLRDIALPSVRIPYQHIESILASVSNIKLASPITSDALLLKLQINSSIEGEIHTKHLDLKLLSSTAKITGTSTDSQVSLRTKSEFNGKDLLAERMTIKEETLSSADVHVNELLAVTLVADSKVSNAGKATPTITQGASDQISLSFPRLKNGVPDMGEFF